MKLYSLKLNKVDNRFKNIHITTDKIILSAEQELHLILDPISAFLESQPNCFRSKMKTIAIVLLDCADFRLGKQKTSARLSNDPDYIPSSARFKFKLTCSKELIGDPRYQALAEDCDIGIKNIQKLITSRMNSLLDLEILFAKEQHLSTFIKSVLVFTQRLTIRFFERNKHPTTKRSIYSILVIALRSYIHNDISKMVTYFDMDKISIFKHYFMITNGLPYNENTQKTTRNNNTRSKNTPNDPPPAQRPPKKCIQKTTTPPPLSFVTPLKINHPETTNTNNDIDDDGSTSCQKNSYLTKTSMDSKLPQSSKQTTPKTKLQKKC
jgi:hypothetical protein